MRHRNGAFRDTQRRRPQSSAQPDAQRALRTFEGTNFALLREDRSGTRGGIKRQERWVGRSRWRRM